MLYRLTKNGEALELEEVSPVRFASLDVGRVGGMGRATEADIENLIAANVNLIETSLADDDEADTMLVIARQATTTTGKRMDLVAMDNTGALILIEVKRDADDTRYRNDHAEIQAVRYAASLAKLRSVEELVGALYAPYIERYQAQELTGERTAAEWARKMLKDFVKDNDIDAARINHAQKIVLVGASLDADTKSAAAWLAANGLPIRVLELQPARLGRRHLPRSEPDHSATPAGELLCRSERLGERKRCHRTHDHSNDAPACR